MANEPHSSVSFADSEHEAPSEYTRLVNSVQARERSSVAPRTYPVRWFVLFVFSLQLTIGNVFWVSMSPINVVLACYYGVDLFWTNALTWVFMLMYVLFFIPAGLFLDRLGLRTAVIVSACVNTIGAWLRFAGVGK